MTDISAIARKFLPCSECTFANTTRHVNLPGAAAVAIMLRRVFTLFYPGCHGLRPVKHDACHASTEKNLVALAAELTSAVTSAFQYECVEKKCTAECSDCGHHAEKVVESFLNELPELRDILQEDVTAAYEGDPAAKSKMEVVMAYPGLYAITIHRVAHSLYKKGVPFIPRIMSEAAHARTGIDIHPGATIGSRFFIDHGTGVVIGETAVIGKNVKLYQGVTLGALSFPKDEATGVLVKGIKRHPNVEDNVVIYAGATILGGETVIGHDSVIGGNVWLMKSVPPESHVYNNSPAPDIVSRVRE